MTTVLIVGKYADAILRPVGMENVILKGVR
jgi:hypothetical protein